MSYNIDAAVKELEQGRAVFRKVLMAAYTAGAEDSKDYWCRYFAPVLDDLATALQAHAPEKAAAILEQYGLEFDFSPKPN